MVSFVDFGPTVLSLAGIKPPEWMQGSAFLGKFAGATNEFLFGFRARMDERQDLMRSVTDGRYVYVRQYLPHLPNGQHVSYMFETTTTRVWKRMFDQGKLNPAQAAFWERKAPEELYDLRSDPDEVRNLAGDPAQRAVLERFRRAHQSHVRRIRDIGFLPEAQMHRRAGTGAPYDMAQDHDRYSLEPIFAMAQAASLPGSNAVIELKRGLTHTDGAVRYWAAMGFVIQGAQATQQALPELRQALKDAEPTARVVAAAALAAFSPEPTDRKASLEVLMQSASPVENGTYLSVLALNQIDWLGAKASPLRDRLSTLPRKDPATPARMNDYPERLLEHIQSNLHTATTSSGAK